MVKRIKNYMKKLFLTLTLAAVCLSAAAQGTPPLRGDFSATELGPFIEALWSGSGDISWKEIRGTLTMHKEN